MMVAFGSWSNLLHQSRATHASGFVAKFAHWVFISADAKAEAAADPGLGAPSRTGHGVLKGSLDMDMCCHYFDELPTSPWCVSMKWMTYQGHAMLQLVRLPVLWGHIPFCLFLSAGHFALLQCIVISFILFYLTAKPPSALATFWGSLLNDDFQLSWFCAEWRLVPSQSAPSMSSGMFVFIASEQSDRNKEYSLDCGWFLKSKASVYTEYWLLSNADESTIAFLCTGSIVKVSKLIDMINPQTVLICCHGSHCLIPVSVSVSLTIWIFN